MNCDGVRGLLSAYLDGQLSPGELLRTEQHLRRCHGCALEVDSLRQTITLVSSLDQVEVPASFKASLHARLVAVGPPVATPVGTVLAIQRGLRRWALSATAAAAAAAILTVGMLQWPRVAQELPGILAANPPVTIDAAGTGAPSVTPPKAVTQVPTPEPTPTAPPPPSAPPVTSPSVSPPLKPTSDPAITVPPTQQPNPVPSVPPLVAVADPVRPPSTTPTPVPAPAPTPNPALANNTTPPASSPVVPVVVTPPVIVPPTIGSVVQNKLSAHAVSYLSGFTRVTSDQTKVAQTHIFTVQTNEFGLLAAEVVSRFGGRAQVTQNHVGNLTASSSIVITLDKASLPEAISYIQLLLGGNALRSDVVETDLTASLQVAESRMLMLDAARERRYTEALELEESEDLDLIMRELDDYLIQFEVAKVDLARLQRQATQATIIINLHKQVQ